MRGKPERDMESLRMMGWGLVVVESSSAAVAVVAVAAAVAPLGLVVDSGVCGKYRHSLYFV